MNDYSKLSEILGLNAMAISCLARIEAMKADNEKGRDLGVPPVYGRADFHRIEDDLAEVGHQLFRISEGRPGGKNSAQVKLPGACDLKAAFSETYGMKMTESGAVDSAFKRGWSAALKAVENKNKKEA